MTIELTEIELFEANYSLNELFENSLLKNDLAEALNDETGETLLFMIFARLSEADTFTADDLQTKISQYVNILYSNASYHVKKYFEYGGDKKSLLVKIKNIIGDSIDLQNSFTLQESIEIIRSIRKDEKINLNLLDQITAYYLLAKTLTPEVFDYELE